MFSKFPFLGFALFFFSFFGLNGENFPKDSIGIQEENGIFYILHQVDPGETLFKIGKRYGVSAFDIKTASKLPSYDIHLGQILKVPRNKNAGKIPVYHVVKTGDNLYSISKNHGITIRQLIDLNEMTDFNLTEGRRLIVGFETPGKTGSTDVVPEEKIDSTAQTPRVNESIKGLPASAFAYPAFDQVKKKKYYEVSEVGEIQAVQDTTVLNPDQLVCLHDFLPVGSLIEITHIVTNRSVLVEVVGKKTNPEVMLQVSPKTLLYLGFRNKNSYKTTILYRYNP